MWIDYTQTVKRHFFAKDFLIHRKIFLKFFDHPQAAFVCENASRIRAWNFWNLFENYVSNLHNPSMPIYICKNANLFIVR